MTRWIVFCFVCALALGALAPEASACWDNTDQIVVKLRKLDLNTTQLKELFGYQREHRAVIKRAHSEGLGCRYHENHTTVFQKKAIGVLTNVQFKSYTGRDRSQVESLQYDNRELRKEIARLKEQLKKLTAALVAKK